MVDSNQLSRTLSHMLRHYPEQYNVTVDGSGWAELDAVLSGVSEELGCTVTLSDLKGMMEDTEKNRFELDTQNSQMRALYAHNERLDVTITKQNSDSIPTTLYHGTPRSRLPSITDVGLQPQSRSQVHLTDEKETAVTVGKRHLSSGESTISVIIIDVEALQTDGYTISNPSDSTYTVSEVPTEYFSEIEKITVTNE